MKLKYLFSLNIILTCMIGCVEIDTASPQASASVTVSKQDGFFISGYHQVEPGTSAIVDSVWKEKVWRYDMVKGEKNKVLLTGEQIVLKLKDSVDVSKMGNYLVDWEISEKKIGYLGTGNRVYILFFNPKDKIDTLQFSLHNKTNNSTLNIGTYVTN